MLHDERLRQRGDAQQADVEEADDEALLAILDVADELVEQNGSREIEQVVAHLDRHNANHLEHKQIGHAETERRLAQLMRLVVVLFFQRRRLWFLVPNRAVECNLLVVVAVAVFPMVGHMAAAVGHVGAFRRLLLDLLCLAHRANILGRLWPPLALHVVRDVLGALAIVDVPQVGACQLSFVASRDQTVPGDETTQHNTTQHNFQYKYAAKKFCILMSTESYGLIHQKVSLDKSDEVNSGECICKARRGNIY